MTAMPDPRTLTSAERMRAEFDRSFAEPARQNAADARDFVLIAAGGTHWALALEGLSGIEHGRPIVPVPSSRDALLGIIGVSSTAIPVFDFATLANAALANAGVANAGRRSPSAGARKPVIALLELIAGSHDAGQRVGVAFERLLQFARVPAAAILQSTQNTRPTLQFEDELYTIVAAEQLLRHILAEAGNPAQNVPPEQAPNGDTNQ